MPAGHGRTRDDPDQTYAIRRRVYAPYRGDHRRGQRAARRRRDQYECRVPLPAADCRRCGGAVPHHCGRRRGAAGKGRDHRKGTGRAAGIHRRAGSHLRRYDENGGVRRAGHAAGVPSGHRTGHPPLFRHRVPPGDARLQSPAGLFASGLHRVPQPRGHRPRLRLYRRGRHRRAAARRSRGMPLSGGALPAALSGAAPRPGHPLPRPAHLRPDGAAGAGASERPAPSGGGSDAGPLRRYRRGVAAPVRPRRR